MNERERQREIDLPGHGRQSDVFCIFGPPQGEPPCNGVGLLQVRVLLCPCGGLLGHRHSLQGPHELHPPSTVIKIKKEKTKINK